MGLFGQDPRNVGSEERERDLTETILSQLQSPAGSYAHHKPDRDTHTRRQNEAH